MTTDEITARLLEIPDLIMRKKDIRRWHESRGWDRDVERDDDKLIELRREREQLARMLVRRTT